MSSTLLHQIKRIKAIADVGLLYCENEFDRERYAELREISFDLLSKVTDRPVEDLQEVFPLAKDYPTAKVDIRGLVLSADNKILMVKESADGRWALPGGWADIGYSPKETAIKEVWEEAGLPVTVDRLLAIFDKSKHPHPPEDLYVYKFVFYCKASSYDLKKGFDVLDVGWFGIADLPPLSEDRILKSQIEVVYAKATANDVSVYFD